MGRGIIGFLVLGFMQLNFAARSANRLLPMDRSFQEGLTDDMRHESLINSLLLMDDDRTILSTVLYPPFSPGRDVSFNLFTRENSDESYLLQLDDTENLRISSFKADKPTKILIHGWIDSANTYWLVDMRKNYLAASDCNVIVVDWNAGSSKAYLAAAHLTRQVGEQLGDFLQYLKAEGNLSYANVHMLGHSLGAHVAGYAGASVPSKIGRITGLDPARPAFEVPILKGRKDRLDSSDASFVDVIHSCAGTAGFVRPIGHADFYPNGGSFRQPGCSAVSSQYCSHGRSHQFMAESIVGTKDFIAFMCESWTDFMAGKCDGNMVTTMGEYISNEAHGKYYLETNPEKPFAKGMPGVDFQTS
ncbi:pancreatic triacylglycerol lipase-like [Venturia canescens]|uniref:pancreatic triacylglycerol lipase-like n=1 Tax=Venturia canescens TaxID=32260 RepID=UPI001C9C6503|nr:pancreatic triacylglycerol lipase-like [Venturia canescens]